MESYYLCKDRFIITNKRDVNILYCLSLKFGMYVILYEIIRVI